MVSLEKYKKRLNFLRCYAILNQKMFAKDTSTKKASFLYYKYESQPFISSIELMKIEGILSRLHLTNSDLEPLNNNKVLRNRKMFFRVGFGSQC